MGKNKEIDKIAEQLVNLTVKDVIELNDLLKDKYGLETISSASTVSSVQSGGISTEKSVDEGKTSFDVFLKSSGSSRLQVIKALKEILGTSLIEAKGMAEEGNKVIKSNVTKDEAENIKKQLEEVGATVEIK